MLASQLRFFRGSGPVLLEKLYIFVIFQGGGSGPPVPHPPLWIRTCYFMIYWYLQRATKTQTSLRNCAFSIQHWWLRCVKHHHFYVELFNCVSRDSNHNLEEKALLYISLPSKFTQLFNVVVCMAFFKRNNIYCFLRMFNFDDQAAYDQ